VNGKRQNVSGFERKRAKQAERRRPHVDKYANLAEQAQSAKEADDERR
jgi:hypothetical protein